MADAPESGPRACVMMEDGEAFLVITRLGESVVCVLLSQRDLLGLVVEAARTVKCE
ncbi:hypothetical protein [Castellaniella sp.]|uniref:hypothetical protein n=1 Tax=Castellaniella sp. TaxID=1955812 RepID=UPI002AFE3849|nr:hypothetical protein [Castellaniella sp.]